MEKLAPELINVMFPITGLTVLPGGIIIKRNCLVENWGRNHEHKRGSIVKVTARSLNRLALLVRSSGIQFSTLMTLTYGQNYPLSGRIAKRHLNTFLTDARRQFGKFEYFWVVEFQDRYAIHFHIATTLPEPTPEWRRIFANIWTRISTPMSWQYCPLYVKRKRVYHEIVLFTDLAVWSVHSHPGQWEVVRQQDGMQRYIAKYANKLKQKTVPEHFQDVGRFWATSKGVKMPEGNFFSADEGQVRQALWYHGREVEHWKILPKTVLVG